MYCSRAGTGPGATLGLAAAMLLGPRPGAHEGPDRTFDNVQERAVSIRAASHGPRTGQDIRQIPDRPACASCRIKVDRVATLGTADGPGALGEASFVVRLPSGRHIVATRPRLDHLLVFDATGAFETTIGRAGGGPREFKSIEGLERAGDGFAVLDVGNGRISTFDEALRLVRESRLPLPPTDALVLSDSLLVLNSSAPTRDRIGLPLHLLDENGEIIRSFGSFGEETRPPYGTRRGLAAAPDGTVWSLATDYTADQWRLDGSVIARWQRKPEWFSDPRARRPGDDDAPEPPTVAARISADAAGRLWVVSTAPDRRWRQALKAVPAPNGRTGWETDDISMYYDSFLEVIDPDARRVLARIRVDGYVHGFADADHVFVLRTDEQAVPRIDILRVRLVR